MNQKIDDQIQAKLALYKRQGIAPAMAKGLIQDEFGVQIQLNPSESQNMLFPAPAPVDLQAIREAAAEGTQLFHARREALELERQAAELEAARDAEIRDQLSSQGQAIKSIVGGLASHLAQHQMQQQGQLETMNPGASMQFLFDGLDSKTRAEVLKNLEPELRQALESAERGDAPVIPQEALVTEPKTLEVAPKKRGFLGLGG